MPPPENRPPGIFRRGARKIIALAVRDKAGYEHKNALKDGDYGKLSSSVTTAMFCTKMIQDYTRKSFNRKIVFEQGIGKTDWVFPGQAGKLTIGSMPVDIAPGSEGNKVFSSLFRGRKGRLPFEGKIEDAPC